MAKGESDLLAVLLGGGPESAAVGESPAELRRAAAEALLDAITSGDPDGIVSAFDRLTYPEADEEEESEE
jgi:hypothetical protein